MPFHESSSEQTRSWPEGRGREFDRLVALSCWFILVIEDQRSPSDGVYGELGLFDDELLHGFRVQSRHTAVWQRWRSLAEFGGSDFSDRLVGEILPDLQQRFRNTA